MNSFYVSWGKRLLDLFASAILLLLLAIPLLAVAGILYIKEGKPIFFCQLRPGLEEKPFLLIKFRTMRNALPEETYSPSDEGRVTNLGAFLRKTSIDELPELWNVLRGDMSLVGPRPLLIRYLPYFTRAERVRFGVRPGITGLAQIQGRNNAPWNERFAADIRYTQKITLSQDLRILLATFTKVILAKDIQITPSTAMLNLDQERSNINHPWGRTRENESNLIPSQITPDKHSNGSDT